VSCAVFASVPMALEAMVPLTKYVTTPPPRTVALVERLPEPLASAHSDPTVAEHDHVTPLNAAGTVSITPTPVAVDGPVFATRIV
jgi:hypothetical protein